MYENLILWIIINNIVNIIYKSIRVDRGKMDTLSTFFCISIKQIALE